MNPYWFSTTQPTKQQAQAIHRPIGLFDPAAVFKTPDGEFVMAMLRTRREWSPSSIAKHIKLLLNFEMVSCCDPLLNVWKDYEEQPK